MVSALSIPVPTRRGAELPSIRREYRVRWLRPEGLPVMRALNCQLCGEPARGKVVYGPPAPGLEGELYDLSCWKRAYYGAS